MTTNGPTSVYVGEVLPKTHPDNPCAELEEANKADEAAMKTSKVAAIANIVKSKLANITKSKPYKDAVKKAKDARDTAKANLRAATKEMKKAKGELKKGKEAARKQAKKAADQAQSKFVAAKKKNLGIKGGKSTIMNGIFQSPDGKRKNVAGCSKGSAVGYTGKHATYAKGRTEYEGTGAARERTGEVDDRQSFLCPEANFEYETGNSSPHQAHTESRAIEDIMRDNGGAKSSAGGLGTLTMNVRWETLKVVKPEGKRRKIEATTSKEACGNCQRLICAAMECGLDVYMCNDDGEAVKPDCEDGKFVKKSSSAETSPSI